MKRDRSKKSHHSQIRLGVNIDHCATLRQVRGGLTLYPDIMQMAKLAVRGGADQITIHLREDRRHIQVKDLALLTKNRPAIINLEMAAGRECLAMAKKYRPNWICFVPEKRQELTTEGGLDVAGQEKGLRSQVQTLAKLGIKSSMFIDASIKQVESSARTGAHAVEFHTGSWVLGKGSARRTHWEKLVAAANRAHELGMNVHAGHGLDYVTTKAILKLPYLEEVNIGHSLVCYALEMGLEESVRKMKKICERKT